jgi:hypothetical protein
MSEGTSETAWMQPHVYTAATNSMAWDSQIGAELKIRININQLNLMTFHDLFCKIPSLDRPSAPNARGSLCK